MADTLIETFAACGIQDLQTFTEMAASERRGAAVPAAAVSITHTSDAGTATLPRYIGFFPFVHNARQRGIGLLEPLLGVLLTPAVRNP